MIKITVSKLAVSLCLTALALPLLGGCPTVNPPVNQAPIVNAGINQSVAPGANVSLNGTASDPDGDTLTITWTQTAGPILVFLTGANTLTPSFAAPVGAQTLTFQLKASDGLLETIDTVDVGVNTVVTVTPILLIANLTGNRVVGYDISHVENVNGNIAPNANLSGGATLLSQPSDIVLDANGSLLVTNVGNNTITSYLNGDDLTGINGNFAPDRNVSGGATTLATPASLAVRTGSDLLFVSDLNGSRILVFPNASTGAFNGNLAPIRTFTSTDMSSPIGINFGSGDTLYVANSVGTPRVTVFNSASTLNGAVAATRVITSPGVFTSLFDVFVDVATDRMFVVDAGDDQIHVFNSASTLNGPVSPSVTLTVPAAGTLTAVAVDAAGIGYIVDNTLNAVYSYDNIATRNGSISPDRTLKGVNTQLSGPIRVFLVQ